MAYNLLPTQKKVLKCTLCGKYRYIFWSSSVRGGKTDGECFCMSTVMMDRPADYEYGILGRSIGALIRNVIPKYRFIAKEFRWKFKLDRNPQFPNIQLNGRIAYLFGGNNVTSEESIAGFTAGAFQIDEVTRISEEAFNQAVARCSLPNSIIFGSFNKTRPNHWFRRKWYENDNLRKINIESTIDENIHIDEDTREQYKAAYSGHWKKRLIDNEWAAAEGVVYADYDVIDDAASLENLAGEFWLAMDFAVAGVTAGLVFAKRKDGSFIILDEYYHDGRKDAGGRRTEAQHIEALRALPYQWKEVIVDPSASPLRYALRDGGYTVISGNNDVDAGIINVDYNLRTHKLVIAARCQNLLGEMDEYEWNKNEDKPIKRNDHACDAMRYGAMRLLPINQMAPVSIRGF